MEIFIQVAWSEFYFLKEQITKISSPRNTVEFRGCQTNFGWTY